MWIKITMHEEMELIEQDGEAIEAILRQYIEDRMLPSYITVIDECTERDIELEVTDYLTPNQIDLLDNLADMEFDLDTLHKILERVE